MQLNMSDIKSIAGKINDEMGTGTEEFRTLFSVMQGYEGSDIGKALIKAGDALAAETEFYLNSLLGDLVVNAGRSIAGKELIAPEDFLTLIEAVISDLEEVEEGEETRALFELLLPALKLIRTKLEAGKTLLLAFTIAYKDAENKIDEFIQAGEYDYNGSPVVVKDMGATLIVLVLREISKYLLY